MFTILHCSHCRYPHGARDVSCRSTGCHGPLLTSTRRWKTSMGRPVRLNFGPVHMRKNHVPKDVSEHDSALSWFESLILALVNAKLFQIRPLKRILKREKRAFWIVIRVESPILGYVNAKLFWNVIRACAFWKCALKPCIWVNQRGLRSRNKILPRSAHCQILIVIGKAFAMHVNAHSSNHDPNHVLDCDPKRLLECDSFSCEHSHTS